MPGEGADKPEFKERQFTSQDGLSLYFRDYGSINSKATPVLCLAGLTRNSRDSHWLARRLGEHRRVLCPDYRGRGRSQYDPDWRNYHPATYVGDIRHMLAALNVHRVYVIGNSLGGIVTMAMGAAMPTSLAGVLINDVGPEIDASGLSDIVAYMTAPTPLAGWDEAVARMRHHFPKIPAATDAEWLNVAKGAYREREDGKIIHDWDDALVKPLLGAGGDMIDLWPLFGSLRRFPLTVVRGGNSDILSQSTFRRMAEVMPDMISLTVPGIGHMPTLAEPEVLEILDEQLALVDATGH